MSRYGWVYDLFVNGPAASAEVNKLFGPSVWEATTMTYDYWLEELQHDIASHGKLHSFGATRPMLYREAFEQGYHPDMVDFLNYLLGNRPRVILR